MRIRTIKPAFWEDEDLGCVSRDARLLFAATFNLADDEGLLRWNPSYVKAAVFMYDDDLDEAAVSKIMNELIAIGVVFPYRGGKAQQRLAIIPNFRKHQQINRPQPSTLPPPPLDDPAVIEMYARRDGWKCDVCGDEIDHENDEPVAGATAFLSRTSQGVNRHPSGVHIAHLTCVMTEPEPSPTCEDEADALFTEPFTESPTERFTAGREGKGREGITTSVNSGASPPAASGSRGRRRTPTEVDPLLFEAWWKHYPRKVGKVDARRAFVKAIKKPGVDLDVLTAGADRYAQSVAGKDPQFVKHPSSWLNGERWLDEPDRRMRVVGGIDYG